MRNNTEHGIVFKLWLSWESWSIIGAAVHETTNRLEMSMDIAEYINLAVFLDHGYEVSNSIHYRMQPWRRITPFSIHIVSVKVSSMISLDDSIRIKHRHYVKYVWFPQIISSWIIWKKKFYDSFQCKRTLSLTRMHSTCYKNSFLLLLHH
jgi:hypothetical protein